MPQAWRLSPALAIAVLGLTCAAPPPQVALWPLSPTGDRLVGSSAAPALSVHRVHLAAALNETISFEFELRGQTPALSPTIELTSFTSAEARTEALPYAIYRVHEVAVPELPGWHIRSIPPCQRFMRRFDVLVPVRAPRGGLPPSIESGTTYRFWADLSAPKGIAPGVYTGSVRLSAGGVSLGEIDLELVVQPFVLPDEDQIPALAELDHRPLVQDFAAWIGDASISPDYWGDHPRAEAVNAHVRETIRLLQAHRISPILPEFAPRISARPSGQVAVSWDAFDDLLGPCFDGTAFDNRVPPAVCAVPIPAAINPRDRSGSAAETMFREYMTQATLHYKQRSWIDRALVILPFSADSGASGADATREISELIRTASAKELKIASRLISQDMRPLGWTSFHHDEDLGESVDVWLPPAQFFDPRLMSTEKDRGRRCWLAMDRPPFSGTTSTCAPPSYAGILPWQALSVGADALYLGPINDWPSPEESRSPTACAEHDSRVLLYPGREFGLAEPVPSIRLKQLRRAMQDAAYVRLLTEHGQEHIGRAVVQALVAHASANAYRAHFADGKSIGWVDDVSVLSLARKVMGDSMTAAASGTGVASPESFARSADWLRLMEETRSVSLRADGVRVRPLGSGADRQAEVTAAITAENRTRVPLTGAIAVTGLVDEPDAQVRFMIEDVPPGASRTVSLTARGGLRRLAAGGTRSLSFGLLSADGEEVTADARLAVATASEIGSPILIDGRLGDWPARAENVLTDFALVVPGTAIVRRPSRQTSAYVVRDDQALYLAVNCEAPTADLPASRKSVRYDDGVPMDEELVEILIDPDNMGTRSPADLYHIVVKRSGADLIEKGIGFDPPWSERSAWAADVDIATREEDGRWIAEIRIPFEAFGPGPHRNEVWGLNVTRFEAAGLEFSTWSGAVGNAYDPLSLGNLYLP